MARLIHCRYPVNVSVPIPFGSFIDCPGASGLGAIASLCMLAVSSWYTDCEGPLFMPRLPA